MKIEKIVLHAVWLLVMPIGANADSALTHTSGNAEIAVTDFGSLGNVRNESIAPNFRFPKSGDIYYLHEWSEIWIGDADGNVASAWDVDMAGAQAPVIGNWETTVTGSTHRTAEPDGRQTITAQYDSSRRPGFPLNLLVDQESFSWHTRNQPDADDFIVIKLIVTNNSNLELRDIYVAIMTNWDVDAPDPARGQLSLDWVDWDEARQTLLTFDGDDTDGINPVHTGLTLLDGKLRAHQIFPFFGFNGQLSEDLFLDTSRSSFMSDPIATGVTSKADLDALRLPPWDYASILSAGPYNIAAKGSVTVTFALVAGESLVALQKNIDAAQQISFAPQRLAAKVFSGLVTLAWEASINPGVGGYTVLRRAKGEAEFRQVGPRIIEGVTFDDTGVENGVEYTYKVRPVDAIGQPLEFDSAAVTAIPDLVPVPPTGLTATLIQNQVMLDWSKSTGQIGGYVIYRNHTGSEPWTQIASVSPDASTFIDVDVYPGLRYFYTVTAANQSGTQSDFSQTAEIFIPQKAVFVAESTLDNVMVVPNPYRLSASANPIEFRNLTRGATIRIYSSAGDLIKRIDHRNNTSIERWNGRNQNGNSIGAGVYVYHIESPKSGGRGTMSARGKFAVVR